VLARAGRELAVLARAVVVLVAGVVGAVERWAVRGADGSPLLDVAGLGLLVAAAWMLAAPAGVAAAGVACLLLSWRLGARGES
jgi:hypothetical protein